MRLLHDRLTCPVGLKLQLDREGLPESGEVPMEVAFLHAETRTNGEAGGGRAFLLWSDPEGRRGGLLRPGESVVWDVEAVQGANVAFMRSGKTGGVVGLEVDWGMGEEVPLLAIEPFSEAALAWFREIRPVLARHLGVSIGIRDYGKA